MKINVGDRWMWKGKHLETVMEVLYVDEEVVLTRHQVIEYGTEYVYNIYTREEFEKEFVYKIKKGEENE